MSVLLCLSALNGFEIGHDGVDALLRGFLRESVALRLEDIAPNRHLAIAV